MLLACASLHLTKQFLSAVWHEPDNVGSNTVYHFGMSSCTILQKYSSRISLHAALLLFHHSSNPSELSITV